MSRMDSICQNWLDTHSDNVAAIFENQNIHCGVVRAGSLLSTYHYLEKSFILSWILTGEGVLDTPQGSYALHSDCICLRRPNHEYHLSLNARGKHHRCYIRLPACLYLFLLSLNPELDVIEPVLQIPYSPLIHRRFLQLLDTLLHCSSGDLTWVIPEIFSFILDITSISASPELGQLQVGKGLLEKVQDNLLLSDVAAACHMSYDHFRKSFQKTYGISPGQYRIQYRIRIAKRMLREGVSIGTITSTLNYPDVYSFSHQFRNIAKCSPSEYAKTAQQRNDEASPDS